MKQKIIITSIFFSLVGAGTIYAQKATLPSGGEATGLGGFSSFSVGQLVYTSNLGAGGTISQGIQQVYDISTTLGQEITAIILELSVYPNPTKDYLNLKVENDEFDQLSYLIYNMKGKKVVQDQLLEANTTINMEKLPKATYFLRIEDGKKIIKTFKIIKN